MLERAKKNKKLTGKELAAYLNVAESTLYHWERGNKHGKIWPLWALEKCGIL